jgi:hypothetical protein
LARFEKIGLPIDEARKILTVMAERGLVWLATAIDPGAKILKLSMPP